ncbi:Non-canonical ubiquitin conjugating enzyme 1 [Handroanthus impetiginosus]|uniref:Non-canonical ubiquitin conjugating enzyme 1 n=1 Tax=Handroanthus impetiginosus TaxID=429701 RepID=A0A2G9H5T1_9LAMI|nr:Non-canonical ubiquitin conjugating enzyme 1 [Handroanthus impetiginosus]
MLLTPNGRFETQTKICLSISNHHPEHWQPSWSVRTALVALIAFMPTSPNGALGSLDYPKEERKALAIKSRDAAPTFGSPERQRLIDEIHEYMLSKAPPVPQGKESSGVKSNNEGSHQRPQNNAEGTKAALPHPDENDGIVEEPNETPSNANIAQTSQSVPTVHTSGQQLVHKPKPADDRLFTWAAFGLTIAIVVLLLKKILKANGHGAVFMNES